MRLISSSALIFVLANSMIAEQLSVVTDIAPVHSLVARVMEGVGEPALILPPGASPHGYSLRPSEAKSLQDAELVFWVGHDLTPWLEAPLHTLAEDAKIIELLELEVVRLLDLREAVIFEAGDGDDKHEHDEDEHGARDPHAWLSPDNASAWVEVIATTLAEVDPENANSYFANARAAAEEFSALKIEISNILEPVRDQQYVVFHDAYQYFEVAFDMPSAGAISISDATAPSPARLKEIQGGVRELSITCVLSEPQFNPNIVAVVAESASIDTAVVDPLGAQIKPGAELYPTLLRRFASNLRKCLG